MPRNWAYLSAIGARRRFTAEIGRRPPWRRIHRNYLRARLEVVRMLAGWDY